MALTIKQGFALPRKELAIFDGDPIALEYWNFIKSFETSIVSNVASESEKFMYRPQYMVFRAYADVINKFSRIHKAGVCVAEEGVGSL